MPTAIVDMASADSGEQPSEKTTSMLRKEANGGMGKLDKIEMPLTVNESGIFVGSMSHLRKRTQTWRGEVSCAGTW